MVSKGSLLKEINAVVRRIVSGAPVEHSNARHLLDCLYMIDAPVRVHGNGFIQIDIPGHSTCRLHVWGHDDIPKQDNPTPIHNHRFGFDSWVLIGAMLNIEYKFAKADNYGGTYIAYNCVVRKDEDTELVPSEGEWEYQIDDIETVYVKRGNHYAMRPLEYHETVVHGPTITFIQKRGVTDLNPVVMVPHGTEPSNEFDRYEVMKKNKIWDIVFAVAAAGGPRHVRDFSHCIVRGGD